MNMITTVTGLAATFGLVGLVVGAAIAYLWCTRGVAQLRLERDELETFAATLQAQLHEAMEIAVNEQRRRAEVVSLIQVSEQGANIWKEKFFKAGVGHSVAHQILLREFGKIINELKAAGKDANSLDKRVSLVTSVVQEYDEKFLTEIPLEDQERIRGIGVAKAGEPQ